jgi:phosphate transport system protein
MALYEKRLQEDLNRIKGWVRSMGEMAERSLNDAVHALLDNDHQLANRTVLADHPINRKMREIDRLCHGFIARHLPSAGHLRLISSIIRINIELERIGDYAVIISRQAVQLTEPMQGIMAQEIATISAEARQMLHQALSAFHIESADMAKATMQMSAHLETTLDSVYRNLLTGEHTRDNREMFAVFAVLTQLKRVADQAKNICEESVFAFTGETKTRKVYKILFVDEDNACLSQMAETIARKNYPNSGAYSSGGRRAATSIDRNMVGFLQQHGFNLENSKPKTLELSARELAKFQIIVSLQGPVNAYFHAIPFHTAFLDWEPGEAPTGLGPVEAQQRYEEVYRELSYLIKELMELLRGEGAG